MSKHLCIISYDISDEKLLRSTARYLEKQGIRLQKSVFAVETTKEQLDSIKNKLEEMLGEEHSVLYFPLCKNCKKEAEFLGKTDENWVFF